MELYFYKGRIDLAATTLADLRLLVAALADESNPDNAATIARVTGKVPPLVQSDVAEPLTLYSYDDAGSTLSSWVTDAAVTVTASLGLPSATNSGAYTTATAAISGSSRLASLVLNTAAMCQGLSGLRPGRGTTLWLHIRQAPANGGETVLLLPVEVQPGVIASPTNEDNAADISAAATSAAAAAVSAGAAASSAAAALISETAADASEAAAAASATAASVSESNASSSADAADADAAAAAASAWAAQTAASGAYKDGVAGASVPATSTLAGDYYRITAVGTSQSKTWAVGDMAVYNGTSGSWTQLSGLLPYATAAQARAGTDTTSALNSSTGNARALLGDMTRRIADMLYSDGATSNRRVELTLGTAGAVAGMPVSFPFEYQVPASNPSSASYFFGTSTSGTTEPGAALNSVSGHINTSGAMIIRENGPTASTNYRLLTYAGFRAAYSGLWVRGTVVFESGDTTTAPKIYVNGVDISASFTLTSGGTAPNWMAAALDTTKFLFGYGWPAGRFIPHGQILGALTAAEVLEWTQTGRLPTWCEVGTGSAVSLVTGDSSTFASGVGVWTSKVGGTITATAGKGVVTCSGFYSGANLAGITLKAGWLYRLKFNVSDIVGTGLPFIGISTGANLSTYSGSYVLGDNDLVVYTTTDSIIYFTGGAAVTGFSLDNVLIYPLGPIIKPVIQPIPVVADAGTNKIAGILTSGVTPITEKRDWVIQASTNTSGNQQLLGAAVFTDATKSVLDDWCMNTAGTPTVTAGSASAGTQYKASGALAATRNLITLVTRVLASTALWCGSNNTSTVQHTVRGHLVD